MRRNQFVGVAGSVVALTDTASCPEASVRIRTSTRGRGVHTPGVAVRVGVSVRDGVSVRVAVGVGLCVRVTVDVTLGVGVRVTVGVSVAVGVGWSFGTGGYTA